MSSTKSLSTTKMEHYHSICDSSQMANGESAQNKRKEKARIAARARRSQEASIIMEMANELQITQEKLRRIDKATIVKLAIDYMKAFEVLCQRQTKPQRPPLATQEVCNNQRQQQQQGELDEQEQVERETPLFSAPKLATASIFAPKTEDNMNSHFLMIEEKDNGKSSFVLKPDTEILDDDDLTHLAPQAGDISISLEVEPLDSIPLDDLLMLSPKSSVQATSVICNSDTHQIRLSQFATRSQFRAQNIGAQ